MAMLVVDVRYPETATLCPDRSVTAAVARLIKSRHVLVVHEPSPAMLAFARGESNEWPGKEILAIRFRQIDRRYLRHTMRNHRDSYTRGRLTSMNISLNYTVARWALAMG